MVDIASNVRATEPLMPIGIKLNIDRELLAELDELAAIETSEHHNRLWKRYLDLHLTPPTWRGRADIYHYDRLMSGLVRIVRTRRFPRVKYADFLRLHIKSFQDRRIGRKDVTLLWQWFRGLTAKQRENFLSIQRDEEAEARRYERLMIVLRKKYPGRFPEETVEEEERFEGWEAEKRRYDVLSYEGATRTAWRSRPAICPRTRRTSSNSSERNRYFACE